MSSSRTRAPLEAIEVASRDEIAALQLTRLKRSLAHAYGNVATCRRKFDEAGVHPDDLKSLDDLARWDAALYDDRLLQAPWRQQAFTPATRTDEPDVPFYGFGWRLNGGAQWHSGESIGFRNVILRYPERHLTVIILTNRDGPEPYPLALKIAQRWLDTLQ